MDFDSLKNQVTNLTLYDIKAGFRKAQNAVMNYTDMEAKVREATNNEPWGCPTSVMQDIANGTFNYAALNEIMPMIYKRFTEKSAEEWRQIYKALQLLEFLIKNGSERVIDDARSHLSLLKMLRQFHYIDHNGKDQGINVRNRAKELAELLADVEKIRSERKKARQTRGKYGGVEGGPGLGSSSSGRYGGFNGDSFGGYSGGVYGDGGGFGGNAVTEYDDTQARRERFEEYDEAEDTPTSATSRRRAEPPARSKAKAAVAAAPPKPKQPEADLFDFGDEPVVPASNGKAAASSNDFGGFSSAPVPGPAADDDFDDFQSATVTSAAPAPKPAPAGPNYSSDAFKSFSPPPPAAATPNYSAFAPPPPATSSGPNYAAFSSQPPSQTIASPSIQSKPATSAYQASQPNYFTSFAAPSPAPSTASGTPGAGTAAAKPGAKADPFANLAFGGSTKKGGAAKGPSLADMAREKSSAGIWGPSAGASSQPAQQQPAAGGSGNDLLGL